MYRIRHYDLFIHPSKFVGAGWRGVAVRALNWVRWKLEVLVQRLVLGVLASRGGFSPEEKQGVLRAFHADVRLEEIEKERTEVAVPVEVTERADRYLSTFRSELEKEAGAVTAPQRPIPLDDLASRYAQGSRARRYARGRKHTVTNDESDCEPLAKRSEQHGQ